MLRAWLASTLAAALLVCGCQGPQVGSGGHRPYRANKIVSLSPSTTEILGQYLLTDKIVGRTAACDEPNNVKTAPVVVEGTKPNFEKIAKIQPDVIVYDAKLYQNTDLTKLESTGASLYKMDVDSLDQLLDFMLQLGAALNVPSRASDIVDDIYGSIERARASAPAKPVRVAILMGGSGEYMAAGTESLLSDVVRVSGGTLVGPPGKVFAPTSVETMVKADPELVLTTGKGGQVLADPRLASTSAVRNKRVFEVPESYVFRAGPKTATLIENLSNKISHVAQ